MEIVIMIVGIIVFSQILSIWFRYDDRRKKRSKIKEKYGVHLEQEMDLEKVRYYIEQMEEEPDIDEITWNDLDMDRVFSRINQCDSYVGEQVLYEMLHRTSDSNEVLECLERQVQSFSDDEASREAIQMKLSTMDRKSGGYFVPAFLGDIWRYRLDHLSMYQIMSAMLILSIVSLVVIGSPALLGLVLVVITNGILYAFGKSRYETNLEMLSAVIQVILIADKMIETYDRDLTGADDAMVQDIKRMKKAIKSIAKIQTKKAIAGSGDIGGMIFDYLIGITLWDFHVFDKVIKVMGEEKDRFLGIYRMLGKIDAAVSIASFRKSRQIWSRPEFHEGNNTIEFDAMAHPLLEDPVHNDVKMTRNHIVTGSNASGKSTFIKAITVNMILAQTINTCISERAKIPRANILTSMAVRDDISGGESYYIKEINYLKRIVTGTSEDHLTLCIVDEILRGTNTEERIAASASILRYMNDLNCVVIVASHDIELCTMMEDCYENIHFEEHISGDDITFDYLLKPGPSRTKNAIKLLSYTGFPEEIVANAEAIVKENEAKGSDPIPSFEQTNEAKGSGTLTSLMEV